MSATTPPCTRPLIFAGTRTILRAPYVPRLEDLKADIAVVGVPFDEGTWNAPGTRYGPRELREGTAMYKMCDLSLGFYYIDGDHTSYTSLCLHGEIGRAHV